MSPLVEYSLEIADLICARIAEGESLRSICRDEGMPAKGSVFRWLRVHPEFAANYDRAIEARSDAHIEEILDIADDGTNDWMAVADKDGSQTAWRVNGEHIARSRLRVDTRKWVASKMKPKKYGDKLDLGTDGGPLQVLIVDPKRKAEGAD